MCDRALQINPNLASAYTRKGENFIYIFQGSVLDALGKFSEAIIMYDSFLFK